MLYTVKYFHKVFLVLCPKITLTDEKLNTGFNLWMAWKFNGDQARQPWFAWLREL
jgi:hypothetical protein